MQNEQRLKIIGVREAVDVKQQAQDLKFLIKQGLDWEEFARSAIADGVAPIIYYNLKKQGLLHLLPQDTQEIITNRYLSCQAHTYWVDRILKKIFEGCREGSPTFSGIVDMSPQDYAAARQAYRGAGGARNQF